MQAYAEKTQEISTDPEIRLAFNNKPAFTPEGFYEATGKVIGLRSIYAKLKSGEIRSLQAGKKHLIPASEVTAFFEREASK
jgi:hypothetical protein